MTKNMLWGDPIGSLRPRIFIRTMQTSLTRTFSNDRQTISAHDSVWPVGDDAGCDAFGLQ